MSSAAAPEYKAAGSSATATALSDSSSKDVWDKSKTAFNSKRSSEYFDPCQDFANRSIKCLNRNGGDRDMCQDYFQAYRDCKKEWMLKRRLGK